MKGIFILLSLFTCFSTLSYSQSKFYSNSSGEIIFSQGDIQFTDEYKSIYQNAKVEKNPVRFSMFFHVQQLWHYDINNNLGFFTGISLRNIGMISNEVLPSEISSSYTPNTPYSGDYFNAKVMRRTYTLGIPLAFKVGSFKDNLHFYAGGEIEWAFQMKDKYWLAHTRSGGKEKETYWAPKQITTFLPSAFIGVQLPKGINVKFKYYFKEFLNNSYTEDTNTPTVNKDDIIYDLSKYEKSNLYYISISFNFKKLIKQFDSDKSDPIAFIQ